ncbi:MAG: hypothetical protein AB1416_14065, partial [Actinomycetota bacterium]
MAAPALDALPATHPWAGRLDGIEQLACADLFRAAPPGVARRCGAVVAEVDGALLMRTEALPGERMFNRAMGLGAPGADLARQLAEVRSFFRGAPHIVSLDGAAPASAARDAARAGYVPDYPWDKFARGAEEPPAAATDLAVREAGP